MSEGPPNRLSSLADGIVAAFPQLQHVPPPPTPPEVLPPDAPGNITDPWHRHLTEAIMNADAGGSAVDLIAARSLAYEQGWARVQAEDAASFEATAKSMAEAKARVVEGEAKLAEMRREIDRRERFEANERAAKKRRAKK